MVIDHPWSDAWLLHSVLVAGNGGPADLKDVIAAADAIEHAILTVNELRYGATRLQVAGLLQLAAGRLTPTSAAREIWNAARPKKLLRSQLEAVAKSIQARPWQAGYDPNHEYADCSPADSISTQAIADAVRAYTEWAEREISRLEQTRSD